MKLSEYNIPDQSLAKLIGINRRTLHRLRTHQNKMSEKVREKIREFHDSWTFTDGVFHQAPYLAEGWEKRWHISSSGYLYRERTKIKNILPESIQAKKNDHLVQFRRMIKKSVKEAIDFHKDKIELPKYDTWFTCVKCEFRVLGRVRSRLKTPNCPICGELVRPCMDCVHYESCTNEKDCFYRRRTDGIKCKKCGRMVSKRANNEYKCGCGYINSWKNSEDFKRINEENGF